MARPILNRRQLLGAILVTGAAGGVGLATAGPAFAGPPADWRLIRDAASQVVYDGVINHQALVGQWRDNSPVTLDRIYRGVRLHNTSRRSTAVRYEHTRLTANDPREGGTTVIDEVRTWTLQPNERKVVWFGGWQASTDASFWFSLGQTQYGSRGWGQQSNALLLT